GRTAPLTASGCGAWSSWHAVTSPDTPPESTCAQYRYRVSDEVGNETVYGSAHVVLVDATAPTVSLDDPGANLRATVALTASADDLGGSGIATVRYEISPAGTATWSTVPASWDTSASGDGLYDVRAVATDVAGNTSVSEVRTNVRVDDTPPTVTLH